VIERWERIPSGPRIELVARQPSSSQELTFVIANHPNPTIRTLVQAQAQAPTQGASTTTNTSTTTTAQPFYSVECSTKMQRVVSILPSWDRTKTASKKGFDKTWSWADKRKN
jgi:hypothetical protein